MGGALAYLASGTSSYSLDRVPKLSNIVSQPGVMNSQLSTFVYAWLATAEVVALQLLKDSGNGTAADTK